VTRHLNSLLIRWIFKFNLKSITTVKKTLHLTRIIIYETVAQLHHKRCVPSIFPVAPRVKQPTHVNTQNINRNTVEVAFLFWREHKHIHTGLRNKACVCVLIRKGLCSTKSSGNPRIMDCVQNVHRFGLFFISSRWYRVKMLPIFVIAFEVPLTRNYHYAASTLFFPYVIFYPQIRLDQSVPLLVSFGWTAADIKTERKCCQCSEWVWEDSLK
jgi:hypothetical protein